MSAQPPPEMRSGDHFVDATTGRESELESVAAQIWALFWNLSGCAEPTTSLPTLTARVRDELPSEDAELASDIAWLLVVRAATSPEPRQADGRQPLRAAFFLLGLWDDRTVPAESTDVWPEIGMSMTAAFAPHGERLNLPLNKMRRGHRQALATTTDTTPRPQTAWSGEKAKEPRIAAQAVAAKLFELLADEDVIRDVATVAREQALLQRATELPTNTSSTAVEDAVATVPPSKLTDAKPDLVPIVMVATDATRSTPVDAGAITSDGINPVSLTGVRHRRGNRRRRCVVGSCSAALIALSAAGLASSGYNAGPGTHAATSSTSSKSESSAGATSAAPKLVANTREGGWGPERRMFKLDDGGSPYPTFNSISDTPGFGDERNFVGLRSVGSVAPYQWSNDEFGYPGDTFFARVYVNNSGADSFGVVQAGWIQGARLQLVTSAQARSFSITGVLSADNTITVWDGATLHYDAGSKVVVDKASIKIEGGSLPANAAPAPTVFGAGATIGDTTFNGVIRPGYKFALYVTVRLKVVTD